MVGLSGLATGEAGAGACTTGGGRSRGGGSGSRTACEMRGSECLISKGGARIVAAVVGGDSFVDFSSIDCRGERAATAPAP